MTESQHKGVVAGFLHVLKTSPDVFNDWMKTPKDDHQAVGALVQRTLGLAAAPSRSDMEAMAKHADEALKPQITELKEKHEGVPTHVGMFFASQQS